MYPKHLEKICINICWLSEQISNSIKAAVIREWEANNVALSEPLVSFGWILHIFSFLSFQKKTLKAEAINEVTGGGGWGKGWKDGLWQTAKSASLVNLGKSETELPCVTFIHHPLHTKSTQVTTFVCISCPCAMIYDLGWALSANGWRSQKDECLWPGLWRNC